jgi:hypothetical protein
LNSRGGQPAALALDGSAFDGEAATSGKLRAALVAVTRAGTAAQLGVERDGAGKTCASGSSLAVDDGSADPCALATARRCTREQSTSRMHRISLRAAAPTARRPN